MTSAFTPAGRPCATAARTLLTAAALVASSTPAFSGTATRATVLFGDTCGGDTWPPALRDLRLIAPLIVAVIFLVVLVLLKALVAPLVLISTVVLSFFAALGAGSLLFTNVLHYPGLDNQVPLLAFLFLVALSVDYNIFLVTRAKE